MFMDAHPGLVGLATGPLRLESSCRLRVRRVVSTLRDRVGRQSIDLPVVIRGCDATASVWLIQVPSWFSRECTRNMTMF